jgi:hypothetical protein
MQRRHAVPVLGLALAAVVLAGPRGGTGAPAPEADSRRKEAFTALQQQLPALVAAWVKGPCREMAKCDVQLARWIGPAEAKVTLSVLIHISIFVDEEPRKEEVPLTFYLRYFEGKWTTTGIHCPSRYAEDVSPLMLAIDRAGDK